jgi:hypothetical protein
MMAMRQEEQEDEVEQQESSEEAEFADEGNETMQRDIAAKLNKKSKRAEREANQSFTSDVSDEEPPQLQGRGSVAAVAAPHPVATRPSATTTYYPDEEIPALPGEIPRQFQMPYPGPADKATRDRALQWQDYFRRQNMPVTPITRYQDMPVPAHFERYIEQNQMQTVAAVRAQQQYRQLQQQQEPNQLSQQRQQEQYEHFSAIATDLGMPQPRSSTTKKKSKGNTGRATPTGEKKNSPGTLKAIDLPPKLNAFRYEHKNRLKLGDEMNPRNKENPGPYTVAQFIEFGSEARGNYELFDLKTLKAEGIRKLASNFGCKGVSSATMFDCRLKMAIRCTAGTVYENLDISNPVSSQRDKKINSFVRVFNCCVSADNIDRFIRLNDGKSRNDYESEGGNPVKSFWVDISDQVNDSENDELLSVFQLIGGDDEDEKIAEWVATGVFNVAVYNQTTHETCAQMIRDMMKATDNIVRAMKQSGHHSMEVWDYCRKTHLSVRKGVEIPAEVAYYVTKAVQSIDGLSGSFSSFLDNYLRCDSENLPNDGDNLTAATASTSRSGQQQEAFLSSFQDYTDKTIASFENFQIKSNTMKQDLYDLQAKQASKVAASVDADRDTKNWEEYDRLCQRVLELSTKKTTGNKLLLRNLCSRVLSIERQIGVDEASSVALEVMKTLNEFDDAEEGN